jgi:hypothetical protein
MATSDVQVQRSPMRAQYEWAASMVEPAADQSERIHRVDAIPASRVAGR